MKWDWWNGKVRLHLEIFQVLVMEWLWQPTRCMRKGQVKRMSWIWIVIPGWPKDQMTSEMKAERCQNQPLNIWCVDTFLELSVEDLMVLRHAETADPDVFIYEFVVFGFYVSDGSTFLRHCYWTTVQTLNDFPHVLAVWIRQCVLKEIFPTFCLDLVDSLRTPWQVLIHSCLFWHIVHRRQFGVRNFRRTCRVIQGLNLLLGFVFRT